MLPVAALAFLLLLSCFGGQAARAQPSAANSPRIEWEVKNRFRLFRNEADFQRHVDAAHGDGVLAAERRLAKESDGRGWARDIVERLCVDRAGRLLESCERDGESEIYLAPHDHRVGVTLAGTLPANEGCVWSFDDGDGHPRQVNAACDEEVSARLVSSRPTVASVDIVLPDGTALRLISEIVVRDVLIGGMGDSIAAGEGNPDRAVQLSDQGFCFKRFGGGEYYRPGRAGFRGNRSCTVMANDGACARGADDPAFDRECFSGKGETFENSLTKGAMEPMACGYSASEFRPYASSARWIRTANDSYFTAMTYPEGLPAVLQPSDLHDAIWGIFAAVYGGAVHPTAEGHAAMADATLPAAREVLGLRARAALVRSEAVATVPNLVATRLPASGE